MAGGSVRTERYDLLNVSTGSAASAVTNSTRFYGRVDSVEIDIVSTAATTCDVTVVVVPLYSTGAEFTLFSTSSIAADMGQRLIRFDGSTAASVTLTGDDPWRYPLGGETIAVRVSNCNATNRNVSAQVKINK